MLLPIGIWEENQSNLLSESQALHLCLVWGGRWRLEPVWTGKKIHMGQYAAWKLQEGDEDLREPLVRRQGSQVPMRLLGGVRHCSRVMVG